MELVKILFPHVLGGSSVVEDEHLRSLCFGDYMHPEAEKKIYDEIPDVTLLTKAMDHYLKVLTLFLLSLPMIFFWIKHCQSSVQTITTYENHK